MNLQNPKHNKHVRRRVRTQGDIKPATVRVPHVAPVNKKWPTPHIGKKQQAKIAARMEVGP